MKKIFFALPGNENLTDRLIQRENAEKGAFELRQFPDGETYIRILSSVKNKIVVLVCTLHQPDAKLLPLYFLSKKVKEMGANTLTLVAPYLSYMRQDTIFNPGEAVTSTYFAHLVSGFVDSLITIDPHLHRRSSLSEIYTIPTKVAHAANHISEWIKTNIDFPLLIGPDGESEQWVSEVAKKANAPYIILTKIRRGDRDVEVSIPHIDIYKNHIPVLIDDIISTGRTMLETIGHLKAAGMKPAICIGVHAVFAGNSFQEIKDSGAKEIITCNTIPHKSNQIDISDLLSL
ncbi:ribose-phosphate pyrophosphokinase [Flavobacterium degerlachei]|jgi:ribose-phosphate pyrophosphokinase|uniref:ribose-phosphate diphosphokinase n=1 Tax=Flavobacterium degerlachei TaxID=229203 RepID=A0A1H2SSV0_9FLAO|nr:ribose-phosphate pyrophosphokinase [Flavobacterium degerlachei]SDW34716.1 ribose-phosphate pyrophosphokinase [Flavobacterium degerlachei]